MEASNFLEKLKELLKSTDQISKEDVTTVIWLINNKSTRPKALATSKGGCLHCNKEIEYPEPLATYHLRHGDEWLKDKAKKWDKKLNISVCITEKKISLVNGPSGETAFKYICPDCWQNIVLVKARKVLADQIEFCQSEQKRTEAKTEAILQGKIATTPARAYWLLSQHITKEEIQELQEMPYKAFLQTHYWRVVRNYVFYKRGRKCFLCPNTDSLQVHHSTYEHRGSEIRYLEDLVILCRNCHAKHHDKLVRGVKP